MGRPKLKCPEHLVPRLMTMSIRAIAREAGVSEPTASRWRSEYTDESARRAWGDARKTAGQKRKAAAAAERSRRRTADRIRRLSNRVGPEWAARIGEVTDREVAEGAGVDRHVVVALRGLLHIPAAGPHRNQPPDYWTERDPIGGVIEMWQNRNLYPGFRDCPPDDCGRMVPKYPTLDQLDREGWIIRRV